MSQYTAAVPSDDSVRPEIRSFFESFYKISDTETAHEQYADHFTSDGKLIMIADEANGRDAIIRKRFAMWEKVSSRSHKPAKIYAFGPDGDDVMLYGTVDYTLKDGKSAKGIDWSARAHFVQDGGKPKMDFYQVYLDSASMLAKAK